MNFPSLTDREHYLELLAGQALGDLSSDEVSTLQMLAPQFPDIDSEEMDQIVAAVDLALTPIELEGMSTSLRQQIQTEAVRYVGEATVLHAQPPEQPTVQRPEPRIGLRESFAWFAATACLLLALFGWMNRGTGPEVIALTPAQLRSAVLAEPDVVQVDWGPGKHPFERAVRGDVVWSGSRQEGYMRFAGFPVNDPKVEQYQLWIIDPSRDDEPVDGGVFDITNSGEVIVPIRAKLAVNDPKAFAITIEKPGGVVVSTQERLPLLAAVEAS